MEKTTMFVFSCVCSVVAQVDGSKFVETNLPSTMSAIRVKATAPEGDWSQIELVSSSIPKIKHGQALIQVNASSVNPVDWKIIASGSGLPVKFPHIIGFDVAGTVVDCSGCVRLKVGDEVWADLGELKLLEGGEMGAYAEFAAADESQVGLKPISMNWTDAASLPLVALTSYQALDQAGAIQPKSPISVFITSGAGGTGHVAIQMAKAYGANVTAVGGPSDKEFILSLGADQFVDYTQNSNPFDGIAANSVDVVYDNYGAPGTADQAMGSLKPTGVYIFLPGKGGNVSKHPKKGVKQINFGLVDSNKYSDLNAISDLVAAGHLRAHVNSIYPMTAIRSAFNESRRGNVQGKIGVTIAAGSL